jgi:zinc transport system substrate-binding protein
MLKYFMVWIGTLLTLIAPTSQASTPQIVVTIKPIHALVSGIMEGVSKPDLLLSGGESPHNYSLQPSQIRKLHAATLVIWVGPTVESFLEKTLTTLSDKTQILRLIDVSGLTLLKVREGKAWETETHHHDHGDHSDFEIDPHIWLSPHNAKILVQAMAQTLKNMDANNAAHYTTNATRLISKLEQLDKTLTQQLTPIKKLPYLVFHDAYQYFEHRYGLTAVGSITLSPEIRPSVKRLHQLRARLKNQQIRCVFSEPQFESALVTTLIENTSAQRGILDPLGTGLVAGTESYFTLLHNLAHSLKQCLQK